MQVTYSGEHSLLIGNLDKVSDEYGRTVERYEPSLFLNTWDYYGLIPKSVPVIAPPDVQENTIEVPGSNGVVDLSEVLLGHPLYYNRNGSLDFYVDHTHPRYTTWEDVYDRLLNDLHGFNQKVILTDAKGYYYEGRIKVNEWTSDKLCSSISLDYNFAPYKRMIFTTYEDWLWDPFDFVNGTIPDKQGWYVRTVTSTTPVEESYVDFSRLQAGLMPVVPDILIDADIPEDYDSLPLDQRPYLLYYIGTTRSAVVDAIEAGKGHISYIKTAENAKIGDNLSQHYLKRDPLISVGAPASRSWAIRLVNPRSYAIKMTINFRQGRL